MALPLRREVASGLRWSFTATIILRIISTTRGLFLARLLGPGAFGLFFALAALANMVALGAEFGLGTYVVHAAGEARAKVRAAATWAVVTGLGGGAVVVAASGAVAGPYGSDARPVALLLALSAFVAPLSAVYLSLLRAELRFRTLAIVQIGAELTASAVAFILVVGVGRRDVWPLASAALGVQLLTGLGAVFTARSVLPHPRLLRSSASREILRFGLPISIAAVSWAVALQGDNLIVGRALGTTALGFYGLAYNYGALPSTLLGSVVGQVAFPVFSHARATAALGEEFVRFCRLTAVLVVPIVAAATAVADRAVEVLLGDQWMPAVTPLRIFLVAGALRGLFPSGELLRAIGRVTTELRVGAAAAPAVVLAALIGVQYDVLTVSLLVASVFVVFALVSSSLASRAIDRSPWTVWVVPLPSILVAATAATGARLSADLVTAADVLLISVTVTATLAAVLAAGALGWVPGWSDLRSIFSRSTADTRPSELTPVLDEQGPIHP